MSRAKYYIYQYYINGLLVYIGKATGNPFARYASHVKNPTAFSGGFGSITEIGIREMNSIVDMEIAEIYLISTLNPVWNHHNVELYNTVKMSINNLPQETIYTYEQFEQKYNKDKFRIQRYEVSDFTIEDLSYYRQNQYRFIDDYSDAFKETVVAYGDKDVLFVMGNPKYVRRVIFEECHKQGLKQFPVIKAVEYYKYNSMAESIMAYKEFASKLKPVLMSSMDICQADVSLDIASYCKKKKATKADLNEWNKHSQEMYAYFCNLYHGNNLSIKGSFKEPLIAGDRVFHSHDKKEGVIDSIDLKKFIVKFNDGTRLTEKYSAMNCSYSKICLPKDNSNNVDIVGQPIQINDYVSVINKNNFFEVVGRVVGFTEKYVKIQSSDSKIISKLKRSVFVCTNNLKNKDY